MSFDSKKNNRSGKNSKREATKIDKAYFKVILKQVADKKIKVEKATLSESSFHIAHHMASPITPDLTGRNHLRNQKAHIIVKLIDSHNDAKNIVVTPEQWNLLRIADTIQRTPSPVTPLPDNDRHRKTSKMKFQCTSQRKTKEVKPLLKPTKKGNEK